MNDRFFRKKWLPLESNPEIFTEFGRQLGLPGALEFFEVTSSVLLLSSLQLSDTKVYGP